MIQESFSSCLLFETVSTALINGFAARRSFSLSLASRQSRHTSSSRRVFAVQRLLSPGNRAIYTAYTNTHGTYIHYTYYLVLESLHFAVVHTHTQTHVTNRRIRCSLFWARCVGNAMQLQPVDLQQEDIALCLPATR